ncbi:MAG: hypothetical protein DBX59_11485 [Bacillota bacterium]|nr:MAG: hypothetical protein DBX59_11485 [Bacillota bacterium]
MREMNTYKLEMHAHTRGGSSCAQADENELAEIYAAAGYGGVVLTNHCCEASFSLYPAETHRGKLDFYFSLYEKFCAAVERKGIRPFLGSEVRAYDAEGYFSEYLLYGFDKAFFYDNPPLYTLTQKELFELCDGAGVFMAQSHPFRSHVKVGYYEYMHGAEVYNGHVGHENRNAVAEAFAEGFRLKKISGTDFHEVAHVPKGGIVVPKKIDTDGALKAFLFGGQAALIKNGNIG